MQWEAGRRKGKGVRGASSRALLLPILSRTVAHQNGSMPLKVRCKQTVTVCFVHGGQATRADRGWGQNKG